MHASEIWRGRRKRACNGRKAAAGGAESPCEARQNPPHDGQPRPLCASPIRARFGTQFAMLQMAHSLLISDWHCKCLALTMLQHIGA